MTMWDLRLSTMSDSDFIKEVEGAFSEIGSVYLGNPDTLGNPSLPVTVRGLERLNDWRTVSLLTPWMLARLFSPLTQPSIPVPNGWSMMQRASKPYTVLGPLTELVFAHSKQKAHVNYHQRLGHYMLQPLIQNMQRFTTVDAALLVWEEMLAKRKRSAEDRMGNVEKTATVSRRAFIGGLARRGRMSEPVP